MARKTSNLKNAVRTAISAKLDHTTPFGNTGPIPEVNRESFAPRLLVEIAFRRIANPLENSTQKKRRWRDDPNERIHSQAVSPPENNHVGSIRFGLFGPVGSSGGAKTARAKDSELISWVGTCPGILPESGPPVVLGLGTAEPIRVR